MPVHNGQRYLERAIASVLAQEDCAFELLVCDDASSDASPAIAGGFGDARLRLLRNERNQGLFPTLNRLVAESRGEIVRLWAQDDVMYPQCLASELRFLDAHPEIAMSYCAADRIDESGTVVARAGRDATPTVLAPEQASELMFYYGSISGNISTVALRRSTFDAVGRFREDMLVSGDFELWVRITERLPIGFIEQPLIQLRQHSGQFSRRRGIVPSFMRENEEIRRTLLARLPASMQHHGRRYLRGHVHAQYAHHVVTSALAGDLDTARATWRLLAEFDRPLRVFLWWLATGNGRWLAPRPRLVTFERNAK
jgi:glycosyltransferase involved in cell wall biosynthesis